MCSRFVPGLGASEVAEGSTLGGLLNRSALMDVPFRGMQRQHGLVYLAALEEPGSEDLDSQINFQGFAGAYQPDYETWHLTGVRAIFGVVCVLSSHEICTKVLKERFTVGHFSEGHLLWFFSAKHKTREVRFSGRLGWLGGICRSLAQKLCSASLTAGGSVAPPTRKYTSRVFPRPYIDRSLCSLGGLDAVAPKMRSAFFSMGVRCWGLQVHSLVLAELLPRVPRLRSTDVHGWPTHSSIVFRRVMSCVSSRCLALALS